MRGRGARMHACSACATVFIAGVCTCVCHDGSVCVCAHVTNVRVHMYVMMQGGMLVHMTVCDMMPAAFVCVQCYMLRLT